MTFTIDSWAIPAAVTVAAFTIAIRMIPPSRGDYDFSPIIGCAYLPIAGMVSLAAWLAWSLA